MTDSKIPERWLAVTRVVWFALVFLLLALFIAGIPPYYNELLVPCTTADCLMMALSPQEAGALQDLGISLELFAGYQTGIDIYAVLVLFPLAGLIYWRRSDTWLGLLLSLTFVFFGTASALSVPALARQYPDLAWPLFFLDFLASMIMVLLFYVFPDGRFMPRWTWLLVLGLVGVFFVDLLFPADGSFSPSYSPLAEALWLVMLLVGVLAQIYRYRRVSTPTQRQQTKWAMFGLIAMFFGAVIWTSLFQIFPLQSGSARLALKLGLGIAVLFYTIFPFSVVFAILRYRLWDIDIIIRRTLVYAFVTALLAVVYFGVVILLQSIVEAVSGQQSAISIVVSTLIIAALFTPLRRRVQDFIDRRFYRRRYNAEKTLANFGQFVRDETDLEALMAELIHVVKDTMEPEGATIWLNEIKQ
jgi:hypothetical protein